MDPFGKLRSSARTLGQSVRQGPQLSRWSRLSNWVEPPVFLFPLLMVTLVVVIAFTFNLYGFTSDEAPGFFRSLQVYQFLASGGTNTTTVSQFNLMSIYGAMPDTIAIILQRFVPGLMFDSRHLVGALFGLGGIYYAWRLGTAFVGRWTGLLAAAFLACNPMWFGSMFANLKDVPFATTLLASTFYGLMALTGRSTAWHIWPRLGLAIGALATTKLLGPIVLGFVGLISLICLYAMSKSDKIVIDMELGTRIALAALAGTLGSLLCFAIFWPQFYFFSGTQLLSIITTFMHFDDWEHTLLLGGTVYAFDQQPWYYSIVYLTISMPVVFIALILAGTVLAVPQRQPLIIASVIVVLAALIMEIATHARVYGGYRHYLFLVPFLMLIAAYAAAVAMENRPQKHMRSAAMVVVSLTLLWSTINMYRLFPYQYSFYNSLVGGIRGADGNYDIDVWRSAEREALNTIAHRTTQSAKIGIFSCGSPMNVWADPRFKIVAQPNQADYIIDLVRDCKWGHFDDLPVVAEVRRRGVSLARVLAVKPQP